MKYICALMIFSLSVLSFAIEDREYNKKYDPARNPFADFETAKKYFSSAADQSSVESNDAHLASSLNDLGLVLAAQGNTSEADATLKRALSLKQKVYGNNNVELVPVLNNLGKLNSQAGNLPQAEDYYSQALSISQDKYGPDHAQVAVCLNNLAAVYRQENKLDQAKDLMQKSLAIS